MVGIEAFFGKDPVAAGNTMMQIADPGTTAVQLRVVAFRRELARQGALFELMGRYAQVALAYMMQSAACNARHVIHARCCRWLLMARDRVGRNDFALSHEFLAIMLGVRRQSVTGVAGVLQAAGLLTYKHGHVTILDGKGLEARACECYDLVRKRFAEFTA
jgi:CRP-like cAMP-binding protein